MDGFAKRFKQLRHEKDLTQEALLADFNKKFHRSYRATAISQYENGKRIPEIDALKDFAAYFGVSVSYLLGDSEIRNPDAQIDTVNNAAEFEQIGHAENGDYIFIAGKSGVRKKIPVPHDKLERFKKLIEAGLPELLDDEEDKDL